MDVTRMACAATVLLACGPAAAATLEWPGAAPCNGSLQACVDAAGSGDTVRVVSEAPIAGGVAIGAKSLALRAAAGLRPELAAGTGISASGAAAGPVVVTVEGFTLRDAQIDLSYSGPGTATLTVRNNDLRASSAGTRAGIVVRNGGSGTTTVQVENNRVLTGSPFLNGSALHVAASNGLLSGKVVHNHVTGLPTDESAWGILLDATGGSAMEVAVGFNEVRGHFFRSAIGASEGLFSSTDSQLTAHVYSNVVVCGGAFGKGIVSTLTDGSMDVDVVNNTIVQCDTALSHSRWFGNDGLGGTSGLINSNIFAHNARGLFINPEFFGSITEADNLFWDNPFNQPAPDASSISADPLFLSPQHPFLRDGSPAIDAGNAFTPLLQASVGLAALDAGGLRRVRGSQVDIGAHEHGDSTLLHTATPGNISGHVSTISGAPFDGDAAARLFATPSYDGGTGPEGPSYGHPFGVYYTGGSWRLFSQDFATMPPGARFNVFAPQPGNGVFTHVTSAANVSGWTTVLDDASVNDKPDRFLLVTQNWTAGGAAVYNPHPVGVFYFAFGGPGSWLVANLDLPPGQDMPEDAGFNVYSQDRSPNAFLAEATEYSAAGQAIVLQHPLLDQTPCAQLQVTRLFDGTAVANHFDVRYNAGAERWMILNHDAAMPAGTGFFVLVDPRQVTACTGALFRDGFE